MKLFVSLMLMVAFVAMTVSTASADMSIKTCSSQLRADDMCYAAALPAAPTDGPQKGGACCDLVLQTALSLTRPLAVLPHSFPASRSIASGRETALPWRPPRA